MKNKNGFTLVELSIVLVIIGLLIGGILVGQSLINSAKNHALISEIQQIHILVNHFKNRFGGLPGDHPRGSQYFPACGANYIITHGNGGGNGNGDGNIDTGISVNEHRITTCQLAQSGMITGEDYRRANAQGLKDWVRGETVIASNYSDEAGILVTSTQALSAPSNFQYSLSFGIPSTTSGCQTMCGYVMTSNNALSVDQKIDDGIPESGDVRPRLSTCGTTAYLDLDSSDDNCSLVFFDPPEYKN